MKNERIIEILADIEKTYTPEQRADADGIKKAESGALANALKYRAPAPDGLPYLVELFRREAEEDIKAQKCKEAGTTEKKKAADNIIAEVAHYADDKKGAYYAGDKIIIGGGYCVVRLAGPFEGLTVGEKKQQPDYIRLLTDAEQNAGEALKMPTRKELKDYIKIEKAKHKGEKRYKPVYDLGEGRPAVDPEKLLDITNLIGDCEAVLKASRPELCAIYLKGEDGDALIMPVRKVKTA